MLKCPYCDGLIEIRPEDVNCKIFRHAVLKNLTPVNPHARLADLEKLEFYGCGMPFWYDPASEEKIKWIDFNDKFIENKLDIPDLQVLMTEKLTSSRDAVSVEDDAVPSLTEDISDAS